MNAITCNDLLPKLGWSCARPENVDALYVTTPLTFPDGRPLDFYLVEAPAGYEMTDDGAVLLALRGLGYALDDRRNWRGLEQMVTRLGFELTEAGEIRASMAVDQLQPYFSKLLQIFAALLAWESEHYTNADSDFSLTRDVEVLLQRRDPQRKLERGATIKTADGSTLDFDFLWGNTYIDAIRPTANAVASRMRKAVIAGAADDEAVSVMFVVDDRQDREKADRETQVLAHVARTMRYTDLALAA